MNARKNSKIVGEISSVINDILIKAEEEAEKIIYNAKKEAEKIISEAKEKAEEIIREKVKDEINLIKDDERRRIIEINLKIKESMIKAREKIYDETIEEVRKRIIELRASNIYKDVLHKLIIEGCKILNENNIIIKINNEDYNLLNIGKIKEEVKKIVGNEPNIKIIFENIGNMGGAIITTENELLIYDNTLSARLMRYLNDIKILIYKTLLGDKY
ncbi:MAG: V-type ATP synthase subunit E family protein [Nitrososphaeria archaeon]